MEIVLPISTGKDVNSGSSQTADFQGFGCSSSSLLTQPILVSDIAAEEQYLWKLPHPYRRFICFLGFSLLSSMEVLKEKQCSQVTGYLLKELTIPP